MSTTVTPRWTIDSEREVDGGLNAALTLFLKGAHCPFRCVFCDLGTTTLDGPTPPGSLPAQIRAGIAAADSPCGTVKLYNASNFFEKRAVPEADDAAIAEAVKEFGRAVVECHPRLIGARMERFGDLLDGGLEVAMGLESVHPVALPKLNKAMTLDDYDRAAEHILRCGFSHRAFVLIGTPFVEPDESHAWTVKSVRHAADRGARLVSLIPLRPLPGSGFHAPSLIEAEAALASAQQACPETVVQLDPWDLEHLSACAHCAARRLKRIERINLSGFIEPEIACARCGNDDA
ncbi:MAG: hypothetical protein R2831_13370 [Chitinophagaceae bacterium]